jgi:hypothetical protein
VFVLVESAEAVAAVAPAEEVSDSIVGKVA